MTILHIITRLILGGAQQNTVMTCAGQVTAGHEVHLAFGPIYGPEGSLLDQAIRSGAVLHEIKSMRRAVLPWCDLKCYFTLQKLIQQINPKVVHTHSSKAGIIGRAAAWSQNVPAVIHTVHGLPFHNRQSKLVHHAYVRVERWAARRCHRLIGLTEAMAKVFSDKQIAGMSRFSIIPSSVDLNLFQEPDESKNEIAAIRCEMGIPPESPVVGIVARFDPLKGHGDLLDILPDLLRRHKDLQLLFLGDGWHREVLERRIRREGLNGNVIFTGLVPLDRVGHVLGGVDVVALPTYQEGQGRVLIEALLCGCGIVAYDVGGVGSICIQNQTGWLVPLGNRAALRDAILDALEDPVHRRERVERGQKHVLAEFDAGNMVEMIQQTYCDALARR